MAPRLSLLINGVWLFHIFFSGPPLALITTSSNEKEAFSSDYYWRASAITFVSEARQLEVDVWQSVGSVFALIVR